MYLYDEALEAKLKAWLNDPKINIRTTETMFEVQADLDNDRVMLPAVGLIRLPIEIRNTNKNTHTAEGAKLIYDKTRVNIEKLNYVPIRLHYQLNIYTVTRRENDELTRQLIFKIINTPKGIIELPYENCHIKHQFNIRLGSEWQDNSDLANHKNTGQLFISTLDIWVDDAALFSYNVKEPVEIVLKQVALDNEVIHEFE